MACQHQYLTGTSCCVAVATKVCTSRSLHTDELTGLQHLSHLSRCFHVYCSSPQDPAPLLQNSAEVPMWQILVEEMSLSFPGMRPLIGTVVPRVAKLEQLPSSPFSPTKPWSGSTSPPSSELIHPILFSTCRPVWLHLSSSFLSSVMLFDSAQVLPFFCPHINVISPLSPSASPPACETQRCSRCALSHAALSSIFLPDDWRCSSAAPPRCTRHCLFSIICYPELRDDESKSRRHRRLQTSKRSG